MHRPSRGGNSGRFGEEQLNTGCTPLYRATEAGDMEVIRALLAKGANPNINDMGFTPFLVAAGVSPGGRGGGGGGAPNTMLLDLMIEHGANVNAQVTGTRTYSMRISYNTPAGQRRCVGSPRSGAGGPDGFGSLPSGEGSQSRTRRCQRQKADRSTRRRRRWRRTRPRRSSGACAAAQGGAAAAGAGGRGGAGGGGVSPATAAEIRAMLQDAASKK